MITIEHGRIVLADGAAGNHLLLQYWQNGEWRPLIVQSAEDGFQADAPGIRVRLQIAARSDHYAYALQLEAEWATRVQLQLAVPGAQAPFHLIPCNIMGDNNLARAEPGHFPNLTDRFPGNPSCSTYWEFRADRASLPVSCVLFEGGIAAVSITPYSAVPPDVTSSREGFIRNGVFAQLAQGANPTACGVTLGYRNTPRTFINKDQWGLATEHAALKAGAEGRIFLLLTGEPRRAVHYIVRSLYDEMRNPPATPLTVAQAVEALTRSFLTLNWHTDREHFTNMRCVDPQKKRLTAWRTLAEVGWTGGGVIAYPLLVSHQALGNETARIRATYLCDWIAEAYNPASGLLWDVCGKNEGKRLNWWWSGYIVKDCHCAYTNGSGLYYLLKTLILSRAQGNDHSHWLGTACRALDTIVQLQQKDGNYGYSFSAERPAILDAEGFAGVWFVPALIFAHQLTGEARYLDSARRGLEFYHAFVRYLNCWGTPMDTWKSLDQEGNLGFLRGASLMHQVTHDDRYLAMLEDGAHYEYLWRYGFRARPEYAPLKGSHWNSCGGSVTSVSNPHIHPMGVFASAELNYLAVCTGDSYHRARMEDGLRWGINCVSLYPEISGYGIPGVLTERFCPSDGLTIETFPDGTPSSMWFSYNGWAAAAVLEGLAEAMCRGEE